MSTITNLSAMGFGPFVDAIIVAQSMFHQNLRCPEIEIPASS